MLNDDIAGLAADVGRLLGYPLLVINDTFHVAASYYPAKFTDSVFINAVKLGEITYEAGALISQSESLNGGCADYIKLSDSPFLRRFAPLTCSGVRLGYLICVDTDGCMADIPLQTWQTVERVLAKQLLSKSAASTNLSKQPKSYSCICSTAAFRQRHISNCKL